MNNIQSPLANLSRGISLISEEQGKKNSSSPSTLTIRPRSSISSSSLRLNIHPYGQPSAFNSSSIDREPTLKRKKKRKIKETISVIKNVDQPQYATIASSSTSVSDQPLPNLNISITTSCISNTGRHAQSDTISSAPPLNLAVTSYKSSNKKRKRKTILDNPPEDVRGEDQTCIVNKVGDAGMDIGNEYPKKAKKRKRSNRNGMAAGLQAITATNTQSIASRPTSIPLMNSITTMTPSVSRLSRLPFWRTKSPTPPAALVPVSAPRSIPQPTLVVIPQEVDELVDDEVTVKVEPVSPKKKTTTKRPSISKKVKRRKERMLPPSDTATCSSQIAVRPVAAEETIATTASPSSPALDDGTSDQAVSETLSNISTKSGSIYTPSSNASSPSSSYSTSSHRSASPAPATPRIIEEGKHIITSSISLCLDVEVPEISTPSRRSYMSCVEIESMRQCRLSSYKRICQPLDEEGISKPAHDVPDRSSYHSKKDLFVAYATEMPVQNLNFLSSVNTQPVKKNQVKVQNENVMDIETDDSPCLLEEVNVTTTREEVDADEMIRRATSEVFDEAWLSSKTTGLSVESITNKITRQRCRYYTQGYTKILKSKPLSFLNSLTICIKPNAFSQSMAPVAKQVVKLVSLAGGSPAPTYSTLSRTGGVAITPLGSDVKNIVAEEGQALGSNVLRLDLLGFLASFHWNYLDHLSTSTPPPIASPNSNVTASPQSRASRLINERQQRLSGSLATVPGRMQRQHRLGPNLANFEEIRRLGTRRHELGANRRPLPEVSLRAIAPATASRSALKQRLQAPGPSLAFPSQSLATVTPVERAPRVSTLAIGSPPPPISTTFSQQESRSPAKRIARHFKRARAGEVKSKWLSDSENAKVKAAARKSEKSLKSAHRKIQTKWFRIALKELGLWTGENAVLDNHALYRLRKRSNIDYISAEDTAAIIQTAGGTTTTPLDKAKDRIRVALVRRHRKQSRIDKLAVRFEVQAKTEQQFMEYIFQLYKQKALIPAEILKHL